LYFKAFSRTAIPDIPREIIFTVEYLCTQFLLNGDLDFLAKALIEAKIGHVLFKEIDFLGKIPKIYLREVKDYFFNQEESLDNAFRDILGESNMEKLCTYYLTPVLQEERHYSNATIKENEFSLESSLQKVNQISDTKDSVIQNTDLLRKVHNERNLRIHVPGHQSVISRNSVMKKSFWGKLKNAITVFSGRVESGTEDNTVTIQDLT
jgi:hypothetical protein